MTTTTEKRNLAKADKRITGKGTACEGALPDADAAYCRTSEAAHRLAAQGALVIGKNTLRYKGYVGSVEFSAEDRLLHGRIMGIKDIVTFEGTSVDELDQDFREAADHYLEHCEKIGKKPDKPFSGKFVLRIPSDLHCAIAVEARQAHTSINDWITNALLGLVKTQ